jgi:hypothetical protein
MKIIEIDEQHYSKEIIHIHALFILRYVITSIYNTFLLQVHNITPAKGQRPSFPFCVEAELSHSFLVQLHPCSFSINCLVEKQKTNKSS